MLTHMRCSGCGILIGPRHVEHFLTLGLCSTCARNDPSLRISREGWLRLHANGADGPPLDSTKQRRGRFEK
jgi:hypothetical protein